MHMEKPRKAALSNLYNTATSQYGFFTTKQAESAGFSRKTHLYHVRAGNWIREHRAVYRLAQVHVARDIGGHTEALDE